MCSFCDCDAVMKCIFYSEDGYSVNLDMCSMCLENADKNPSDFMEINKNIIEAEADDLYGSPRLYPC